MEENKENKTENMAGNPTESRSGSGKGESIGYNPLYGGYAAVNKVIGSDSLFNYVGLGHIVNPNTISFAPQGSLAFGKGFVMENSIFNDRFKLEEEISDLKRKLKKAVDDLDDVKRDKNTTISEIKSINAELEAKQKLNHIVSRISDEGGKKLLTSLQFQEMFKNSSKCDAVVVSIDIRRSTELMLKAKTPELFSEFITGLSSKLAQIVIANFGIFDKFTGDGILAFFPKFYSGNEAVIRAIKTAEECHLAFNEHYNNSKHCFNVFIKDVGLGIGIDFGNVTLVNNRNELTVVGIPVVYACRFSGAKAGETLINCPAKEEIARLVPTMASFNESEINIKNEGLALGYNVFLNEAAFEMKDPDWDALMKEYKG